MTSRPLVSALALGILCACDPAAPPALPAPGLVSIVARSDGRIDLVDDRGTLYLRGAFAEVTLRDEDGMETLHDTRDCGPGFAPLESPPSAAFPSARGSVLVCPSTAAGVALRWELWVDPDRDAVIARLTVRLDRGGRLIRTTPLRTEGADAGLFVGLDPDRHRVLDDGNAVLGDTEPVLHALGDRAPVFLGLLSIAPRGRVIATWDHAIVDLDSGRSWIAGTLAVERAVTTFGTAIGMRPIDAATGRVGIEQFAADQLLLFDGIEVAPGGLVTSEPIWIDPAPDDPWSGLERWADAAADFQERATWVERGNAVPTGWNSWSGGSGSGGLGQDIDEPIVRENLDVLARELAPYGIEHFQLDDGWQTRSGDWTLDPARFPAGMDDLIARIDAAGLSPGLWLEPFIVDAESEVATMHPEWLRVPADHAIGPAVLQPSGNERALDLSDPDARAWVGTTLGALGDAHGLSWMKLDFTYLAFPYRGGLDGGTAVERQRAALRAIRDGVGDDTFLLGIGLVGMWMGIADGMRLTLDDGPRWGQSDPFSLLGDGGSLQSSVIGGARRWYLSRMFVPHDDLLFFRPAPDARALTLSEATTFASFIGLSGGIVKIGEDMRTLSAEQLDVIRRLLPVYPSAARPMDVFTRHYPEVHVQHVDGTLAGSDAEWWVIGLLHWGRNFDHDVSPPMEMPDVARTYEIDLGGPGMLGLEADRDYVAQEFWSETYLGVVRGRLVREVEAHGHAVIALRPVARDAMGEARPQLLGTNRHISQGATDLAEESWDEATRTLRLVFDVDAAPGSASPLEHRIRVRVPEAFAVRLAEIDGDVAAAVSGEVLTLTFTPAISERRTISIPFDRPPST